MATSLLINTSIAIYNIPETEEEVFFGSKINAPTDLSQEYISNQNRSIEQYNQILDNFKENTTRNPRTVALSDNAEVVYPDYYGGAYIDLNTGKLIVLVNNEYETRKISQFAEFKNVTDANTLSYESCDFSYNEICELIEYLSDNIDYFKEKGIEINSIADDILTGSVLVKICDKTDEKVKIIKEFCNSKLVRVEESERITAERTAGGGYGYKNGTIGFVAKKGNTLGVVVAGHCEYNVGAYVKWSTGTAAMGTVHSTSLAAVTEADATFVATGSATQLTSIMANGGDMWGVSTTVPPVNTRVYMLGMTSNLQSGKITATNVTSYVACNPSITLNGEVLNRFELRKSYRADYTSASGDSGAPILYYEGNMGSQSKYRLYGIHSAGGGTFTPYNNIVSKLGATYYDPEAAGS